MHNEEFCLIFVGLLRSMSSINQTFRYLKTILEGGWEFIIPVCVSMSVDVFEFFVPVGPGFKLGDRV